VASKLVSVTWEDHLGRKATFSFNIEGTIDPAGAEMEALLDSMRALSSAKISEVFVSVPVDISGLTNPAASVVDETLRDQAVMQLARRDNTGNITVTIPSPADGIFMAAGTYAGQDVDPADADVLAFVAAGVTADVLATPQDTLVNFKKGWRKGQPHS